MPGQIVGRVAIKVIPDTTDFRRDTNKALEKIEKSLRKIKVQATFDQTGLKSEVLRAIRELNAEMKTKDAYKVKLRAAITTDGMKSEIRKAVREMTALARGQQVKFQAGVATTAVDLELDRASLDKVKKELEHWRDGVSPLQVHVAPEMLAGASSLVAARLQVLTRPRMVPIIPTLDKSATASVATALAALAGGRVLNDMLDNLWTRLKRLDKSVPIIGTVAEAVAGLGAWGLTAASNLFSLSSSLASIAGAGLALPGIFGGMAIGLGTSIAVLKDFNKVLPEVKGKLSDLQNQMSEKFWTVAEAPIRRMINELLPGFSKGLRETATSLGGFFGTLATAMHGVLEPILGSMFDDLNESIDIAGQHTQAFATIIARLGEVGAGMLPRLAGWFGDISDRFANFLTDAAADGRLQQWIDTGVESMKELGRAIGNAGGILHGLADIAEAAGGSNLTSLADKLQAIEDVVKGSTFSRILTKDLRAAHEAMDTISNTAGPAFEGLMKRLGNVIPTVFGSMSNTVGTAFDAIFKGLNQPAVSNGLVTMFKGLETAVAALAPAMKPVGKALGAVMGLIGTLAANLGPTIGAALGILAPIFTDIVAAVSPLVEALGPVLTGIIRDLAPVFQAVGDQVVKIAEAMQPLVAKFQELWDLVSPVLVPALQILAEILGGAIVGAIEGIIGVIDGVMTMFNGFKTVIEGIIMALSGGDLGDAFGLMWEGIKVIFSGAIQAIGGALKTWLNVSILGVFRGGFVKLLGLWKGGWTTVANAGKAIWNGIKAFLSGFLNGVRSLWRSVWGGIKTFVSGVWQAIKGLVSAALNAMRGNISGVMNGIKTFISGVLKALKGIWQAAWNGLKSILSTAWNGIKTAVSSGIGGMMKLVGAIPGKVNAVFAGAASWLWDAGINIIQGLLDGIGSMIGKVQDKLSGLTNMIPDWKGPKKKDKRLLYNAGRLIIQGLNKGLESKFKSVQRTLGKLTNLIPKDAGKAFRKRIGEMRKDMLSALKEWQGVRSKINSLSSGLVNKVMDMGDVTKQDTDSFQGIKNSLEGAVAQAKAFDAVLKKLRKLKLNGTAMEQIIAAGPESLTLAQSIADAGKGGVAEINKLQQHLATVAKRTGGTVKDAMYANGTDMARGLLRGLRDHRAGIEREMENMGDALVRAIRRKLKIHSPSRVFVDIGANVSKGLVEGIKSVDVQPPEIAGVSNKLAAVVGSSAGSGSTVNKTLNYYAAPGSSLDSKEDLFKAAQRGRMAGW